MRETGGSNGYWSLQTEQRCKWLKSACRHPVRAQSCKPARRYRGIAHATATIIREEGPSALFKVRQPDGPTEVPQTPTPGTCGRCETPYWRAQRCPLKAPRRLRASPSTFLPPRAHDTDGRKRGGWGHTACPRAVPRWRRKHAPACRCARRLPLALSFASASLMEFPAEFLAMHSTHLNTHSIVCLIRACDCAPCLADPFPFSLLPFPALFRLCSMPAFLP